MQWNTYNPIYVGQFDSFDRSETAGEDGFRIEYTIYKKNYSGPVTSLLCSAQPLVHRYLNDDPIAPVKGSEVEIKFLNKDHLTPLSLFYSEEDDTFKIKVERAASPENKVIFEGYLVQEDCTEVLVDFTHELSLVFTDNIGLLKNVKLDEGNRLVAKSEFYNRHYVNAVSKWFDYFEMLPNIDPDYDPMIGDTMILESNTGDTIYQIVDVKNVGSGISARVHVYVDLEMPAVPNGSIFESVFFITPHNIQERLKLGDILKICLQNTGLMLFTSFGNIASVKLASGAFTSRLPENIYIDCKTFKNGDDYDSLYDILEKILYRFTSSLFQCQGYWKMHRWLELPMVDDAYIIGKFYDPYFRYSNSDFSSFPMQYGFLNDIETGANETIYRPLKYVKHTFDFEQPTDMLFNYKLDYLGEFIRQYTYTIGPDTFTVKCYEALGWLYNLPSPYYYNDREIQIVYDAFGNEKERFIAVYWDVNNNPLPSMKHRHAGTKYMEVNAGDTIKYSFDWRQPDISGSVTYSAYFQISLVTPTQEYYCGADGNWTIDPDQFLVQYNPGTDFNEYQTVILETKPIPYDGLLVVWLSLQGNFTYPTQFKNFNFEYTPYIAGRTDVKRQTHTAQLPNMIKNNEDKQIFLDDTLKNYAKGTLFLPTFTNNVQDKTAAWRDGLINIEYKLGEIITKELNLWRYMQRSKIELKLWPLLKNDVLLSMDTVIDYQLKTGFFYIFGRLEIDYKANQASGTIYEIFNPVDMATIIDGLDRLGKLNYKFNYLFK